MENILNLLRSIVPLILNVSHYMTDIIYLLYYLERIDIKSINKGYKIQLTRKIITLREEFRELLKNGSMKERTKKEEEDGNKENDTKYWEDEMNEIVKFYRMLNDQDLLNLLHRIIKDIINNYTIDPRNEIKLKNQIKNCEIGLNNIIGFLNHIVDIDNNNIVYDDNINKIFNEELINSWRIQLDLFNCLIFDILTHETKIIELFNKRYKCDINEKDLSKGDTFIKFITWLKDEEVFDSTVDL